jgi:hypothetical protein
LTRRRRSPEQLKQARAQLKSRGWTRAAAELERNRNAVFCSTWISFLKADKINSMKRPSNDPVDVPDARAI